MVEAKDLVKRVDWIRLEFYGVLPAGYYNLTFWPDGSAEYTCDGVDLPYALPNGYRWAASKRVYRNLAMVLLDRPWDEEVDPRLEFDTVCDGWTDRLTWSVAGIMEEQSLVIGEGPSSLLQVMERIQKLMKDEEKKNPHMKILNS